MPSIDPFQVLCLCTGSFARSTFGESLIRRIAAGPFITQSAGAKPRGEVNRYRVRVLRESYHLEPTCSTLPDKSVVTNWSSPDPAEFRGDDEATFTYYQAVAAQTRRRIELMCHAPLASLNRARRERLPREIGDTDKHSGQE